MKKICIILAMILSFCGCFGGTPVSPGIPEDPEIFPDQNGFSDYRICCRYKKWTLFYSGTGVGTGNRIEGGIFA